MCDSDSGCALVNYHVIEIIIETLVEVWENEKCCVSTSRSAIVSTAFFSSPKLPECFYNSITHTSKYMKDHIFECGEGYEDIIDHHSYTHNLSSCEIKA